MEGAREILNTITTDEGLTVIQKEGLLEPVMGELMERISYYLNHRTYGRLQTEAVLFSNEFGYLGETKEAKTLAELLRRQYPCYTEKTEEKEKKT